MTELMEQLLAFVKAEGRFKHLGGSITTYPDEADDKHSAMLELERLGEVRRLNEYSAGAVLWVKA